MKLPETVDQITIEHINVALDKLNKFQHGARPLRHPMAARVIALLWKGYRNVCEQYAATILDRRDRIQAISDQCDKVYAERDALRADKIEMDQQTGIMLEQIDKILDDRSYDGSSIVEAAKIRYVEAFERNMHSPSTSQAGTPERVEDAIGALAERFWRVHPKEIQDSGLTRSQWYAREMRSLFATLSQPEHQGGGALRDEPDEALVEKVARAIAENGVGRPWDEFKALDAWGFDQSDLKGYARAAIATLTPISDPKGQSNG